MARVIPGAKRLPPDHPYFDKASPHYRGRSKVATYLFGGIEVVVTREPSDYVGLPDFHVYVVSHYDDYVFNEMPSREEAGKAAGIYAPFGDPVG